VHGRQAREAYERGLEIEPDDRGLQEAAHAAHIAERKAVEARAHKFKRREAPKQAPLGRPPGGGSAKRPRAQAAAGVRNQAMLSFGDDEDEQE
jgi:hypothetical protein